MEGQKIEELGDEINVLFADGSTACIRCDFFIFHKLDLLINCLINEVGCFISVSASSTFIRVLSKYMYLCPWPCTRVKS